MKKKNEIPDQETNEGTPSRKFIVPAYYTIFQVVPKFKGFCPNC